MPNKNRNKAPEGVPQGLSVRTLPTMQPSTYREDDHSVEFVLTTEEPAIVFDWERFELVQEVLVSDGMEIMGDSVPLLNCHSRRSTDDVLGSVRDFKREAGQNAGRAYFDKDDPVAMKALNKVKNKYLDSGSVGYEQIESEWIKLGETTTYNGKQYNGPMLLTKRWRLKEFSLVPIGADLYAKVRQDSGNDSQRADGNILQEGVQMPTENNKTPAESADLAEKATENKRELELERKEQELARRAADLEIKELCTKYDCKELAEKLIAERTDVATATQKVLETVADRTKGMSEARITIGAEHEEKERAAIVDAALMQIIGKEKVKNPAPGADSFRGVSMTGIASKMLRRDGVNTDYMSKEDIVSRALMMRSNPSVPNMGSGNFSSLLANVAEKVLMTAWQYAPTTYQAWCKIGSLPDFKASKRVQVSAAPDMLLTPEFAEVQYGQMSDTGEDIALSTYARRLVLTRQAIINDDLDYFNTLFTAFGARAAALINRLPYAVLAANGNLADGDSLFDGALHTADTALSATSAGVAVQAFGRHKALAQSGEDNMYLNAPPRFVLVGYANWVAARILFESMGSTVDDKNSAVLNPYNGMEVIFDANITSNAGKQHYYVADPSVAPTVEVAFLNGRREPTLIVEETSPVLGVAFTGLIDATAKALQRQGIYRNQGG